MGERADLETAESIQEYLEEVTLPELEATLAATLRTVEWLKEQIQKHQNYNPKQSSKRLGEGDG